MAAPPVSVTLLCMVPTVRMARPSLVLLVESDVDKECHANECLLNVLSLLGVDVLRELERIHLPISAALVQCTSPQVCNSSITDWLISDRVTNGERDAEALAPGSIAALALNATTSAASVRPYTKDRLASAVHEIVLWHEQTLVANVLRFSNDLARGIFGLKVWQEAAARASDRAIIGAQDNGAVGVGAPFLVCEQDLPSRRAASIDRVLRGAGGRPTPRHGAPTPACILCHKHESVHLISVAPVSLEGVNGPINIWLAAPAAATLGRVLIDHDAITG